MHWYHSLAAFFAGAFLANAVPHFIHGVSGNRFPTPFAHPPGKGLSSSTVNTVWALANLVVGYLLVRAGRVTAEPDAALILFFAGIAALSILSSISFAGKHSA